MRKIFFQYLTAFSFATFPLLGDVSSVEESKNFLTGRLDEKNMRYATFVRALELLRERKVKTIIETGTARSGDKDFAGDGGSTVIFADWALHHNATMYSVDISPKAIENARIATEKYSTNLKLVCSDSIKFLVNFNQPIDFLYLDSFDYQWGNPRPSQEHHLKEVLAAYPFLHSSSVIMIDDCTLPDGGKGKLAIEFLTSQGWEIVEDSYQVILIPGSAAKIKAKS